MTEEEQMHAVDGARDSEREQVRRGRTRREALTKAAGLAAGTVIGSAALPPGLAGARTRSTRHARHFDGDKRTSGLHYHTASYPAEPYPSYDLGTVDQWNPVDIPDIVPAGGADRQTLAHELATDATIWGYASALQYVQLYQQAVDKSSPSYTGFDAFLHQRNLADPSFSTFRTPNVDTLYSNAWLDLTQGPALIEYPAFGNRYYNHPQLPRHVLQRDQHQPAHMGRDRRKVRDRAPGLADRQTQGLQGLSGVPRGNPIHVDIDADSRGELHDRRGNGARSSGPGEDPAHSAYRPGDNCSRHFYLCDNRPDELLQRARLDRAHKRTPHTGRRPRLPIPDHRDRGLQPFDPSSLDSQTAAGMAAGFAEASAIISDVKGLLGTPVGSTGWVRISPGAYGFNYLRRATTNFVGTGGNVREEQVPFTTFVDGNGKQLNGATTNYTLHLDGPPPAGFWSATLYILSTGETDCQRDQPVHNLRSDARSAIQLRYALLTGHPHPEQRPSEHRKLAARARRAVLRCLPTLATVNAGAQRSMDPESDPAMSETNRTSRTARHGSTTD